MANTTCTGLQWQCYFWKRFWIWLFSLNEKWHPATYVAWLLFCLGILVVGEIKLVCQSSLSLSFSAKLTWGRRLGWAGLQLWQSACLFGVTILWSDCWKDKYLQKGRQSKSICFHSISFASCSEQMTQTSRVEWNRLWEMNLMNGRYRYVASGDKRHSNRSKSGCSSILPSCGKDGRYEYSRNVTPHPHLSIQWHAQMLNRCGAHYAAGSH